MSAKQQTTKPTPPPPSAHVSLVELVHAISDGTTPSTRLAFPHGGAAEVHNGIAYGAHLVPWANIRRVTYG